MPALIPFNPPWWQILLSVILLVVGFLAAVSIAAKIYRVGMLLYGKKPSYKEIFKWLTIKV
jgi:ABC-2 type transport system permease protein